MNDRSQWQDWETVTFGNQRGSKKPKTQQEVREAKREGKMQSVARVSHKGVPSNARRLDEETEVFTHAKISTDFKIALQQARQNKGITQSQLAQRIGEKSSVINQYESGKAIPNPQIIGKMQRVLGTKLPKIKKPPRRRQDE